MRRPHHMDAYFLSCQDVDSRTEGLAQALCAPAHAVQSTTAVVDDRHGFHESESVCPRRSRVRLYRQPNAAESESNSRILARRRGSIRTWDMAARCNCLARYPKS